VQTEQLAVSGAWRFTPQVFPDARGRFAATFQDEYFRRAVGHPLTLAQANTSVSQRGVLRGIHYSDVPPGQAKYVQCVSGAILDIVVDIRVGSETFGRWDAVRLDPNTLSAVYLSEGLGHAFLALENDTVVSYLCSTPYNPSAEHCVDPLDRALGLPWGQYLSVGEMLLSDKDRAAPSLADACSEGRLPTLEACRAWTATLAG
jgi:dTDP-4-dehydrorhamnose 3,5-epimerase